MADAGKRRISKTPAQRVLSVLKWVGVTILGLAVIAAAGFGVVYVTTPIPDPNKDFQTNVTTVFYRDGQEQMGSFAVQNRVSIAYEEMPQNVKDAIVAGENQSFWTDPGISIEGIIRAIVSALGPGDTVGGSTITQQYVKILYLSQDKTLTRKLKEIVIALKVGQELPKERILEGYLNTVYFGRGAYGIQAAAQNFFAKDAKALTLPEAVVLASVINSPANLDPANGSKQAADLLERYQYTLNGLVAMGKITEAEKAKYYTKLPAFPKIANDSRFGGPKGYLLKMVQEELLAKGFTAAQINGGGLQVTTTIDAKAQDAAVKAAQDQAENAGGKKAAELHPGLASVDNATGAIIALYGGPDYVADNRNWGTTPRPTGSTFKVWTVVAALQNGMTLSDQFNGNSFTPRGESKPVTNAGNYGPVSLLRATQMSINSAFVDLVLELPNGSQDVMDAANDLGIPRAGGWELSSRISLGPAEVSPLSAASALATLVNEGKRNAPFIVAEVKDMSGASLYKHQLKTEPGVDPDVARDTVYALESVTHGGTGSKASALRYPTGGKTGTRDEGPRTSASWFIGFTKQISTAVVFTAGPQGTSDLEAYKRGFYGSSYPLATWLQYMKVAMDGLPREDVLPPTRRVSTRKPSYIPRPTSARPTTVAPTSASPTAEPSTAAPTSAAPTSEAPTTQAPTTSSTPKPGPTRVTSAPPGKGKGNDGAATSPEPTPTPTG